MEYLVLRNCFTEENRYFAKGDVVDLPEAMFKHEKNFRLLSDVIKEVKGVTPTTEPEKPIKEEVEEERETEETSFPVVKTKPTLIPNGKFWCTNCEGLHFNEKKNGRPHAHIKYKG